MNIALFEHRGAIEVKKDRLVKDLKGVVTDTDELLQQVVDSSAEEFAAARSRIEGQLRDARSRLDAARIAMAKRACDAADATQEYVRENPWKAFGIPAVAGLIVFMLLSTRR